MQHSIKRESDSWYNVDGQHFPLSWAQIINLPVDPAYQPSEIHFPEFTELIEVRPTISDLFRESSLPQNQLREIGRVRNSPVEIEQFAIDLGGAIDDVRAEVQRLAMRLRACAGAEEGSSETVLAG